MDNIFNEELVRLNNERNELVESQFSIANDLAKEIEIIKQKYENLGKKVQDKIDSKNGEIDDLCELVARYSWFDGVFSQTLADLMTTFEGRSYVYQTAEYKYTEGMGARCKDVVGFADFIILADSVQKNYWYSGECTLDDLVANGQAILLNKRRSLSSPSNYCFYEADLKKHLLDSKVKLDKFGYVEEFVNRVIEYRINNKEKEISPDTIVEIEADFLRDKEEEIRINFNIRQNEDQSLLEKRREERKNQLEKKLKLHNN